MKQILGVLQTVGVYFWFRKFLAIVGRDRSCTYHSAVVVIHIIHPQMVKEAYPLNID